MACIDRCVPKYLETHEFVGKEIDTVRTAMTNAAAASTKPATPGSSAPSK